MKNYITVAALLAAGTAFANAETLTLDSKISGAPDNTSATDMSAWTYIYGKAKADIGNTTAGPIYAADNGTSSFLYAASVAANRKVFTLSDLYISDGDAANVEFVSIDSLSFFTRSNSTDQPANTYIQVVDTATSSVVATSEAITYTATTVTGGYGTATALFTETNQLNFEGSYTFNFVTISEGTTTAASVGQGLFNPYYFSSQKETSYLIDGISGYSSVIRVGATIIPEPSAFGLLAGLGALALVGTRRRRR